MSRSGAAPFHVEGRRKGLRLTEKDILAKQLHSAADVSHIEGDKKGPSQYVEGTLGREDHFGTVKAKEDA